MAEYTYDIGIFKNYFDIFIIMNNSQLKSYSVNLDKSIKEPLDYHYFNFNEILNARYFKVNE